MDWRIGYHSVSTCASWGLATWREQEGAVAWKLLYYFSPPNPAYAGERSKRLSPPFDDGEFDQFGWKPAKGTHWDGLSYSGRSSGAGDPVSCGDLQARQKALYSNVRIEITTDARIVGKVKDPAGDGVPGVRVRAKGAGSDRTDAEGEYQIDVPETNKTYKVVPSKGKNEFKPRKRSVTVKPGETKKANFTMKVERTISGRIKLDCGGSCPVGGKLPVEGVKVRASPVGNASAARSYNGTTGTDGRFKIHVKKGKYRVRTRGSDVDSSPSRRSVNLTRKRKGTANFDVCLIGGSASAFSSLRGPSIWDSGDKPGGRDCLNQVKISWSGGPENRLEYEWSGRPICISPAGQPVVSLQQSVRTVGAGTVNPAAGDTLVVNPDKVDFNVRLPATNASVNNNLSGTIRANGTGTASGQYERASGRASCEWGMTALALARRQ